MATTRPASEKEPPALGWVWHVPPLCSLNFFLEPEARYWEGAK